MLAYNFTNIKGIAEGSFSQVFRALRKEDSLYYALKRTPLQGIKPKELQRILNEVRVLASVDSPFVIAYKQAILEQNEGALYVVMEYADGGDLRTLIRESKENKKRISENEIWRAASHLLHGLRDLHLLEVVHRDLKPANIFLSKELYKIGDFNVCTVIRERLATTQVGSPCYASPQVWLKQTYDSSGDIWSLGCILYEMCNLRPPFVGHSIEQLSVRVLEGQFQRLNKKYSKELEKFIGRMLQQQARPSAKQLLQHPKITKFGGGREQSLLKTIKIPKNLNRLKEELPDNKYPQALPPIKSSMAQDLVQRSLKIKKSKRDQREGLSLRRKEKSVKGLCMKQKGRMRRIGASQVFLVG